MAAIAPTWNCAVIVGASSGIGEALARELGHNGTRLVLVARRLELLERLASEISADSGVLVLTYQHDVRNSDEAATLLQRAATELGGLDLVVYASGIMPAVPDDEYPTAVDIDTIDINLSGAVAWLNAAAARFSIAEAGTIVAISSVAGDRGRRTNPVYGATKAALNVYVESLRNRLAGRGVSVVCVRPGYVETPLISRLKTPGFLPRVSAEAVAHDIIESARKGERVVYLPRWWRLIMLAVRAIPAPLMERLNF